jgi:DNA-binding winged helix-turn-helix (wHTH) protein/tetratricopeptide (TPR) repeat protein
MAQGLEPRRFRFGPFDFDPDSGELRKHGTRISLARQPADLLAILVSRPGALFTREELRQQLWPGGTFVDFDHGLNVAVTKIRVALGDSAANPEYIETIPRRGYRFIAPVESEVPAAAPREPAPSPAPAPAASALEPAPHGVPSTASPDTETPVQGTATEAPSAPPRAHGRLRTTRHAGRLTAAVVVGVLLAGAWFGLEGLRHRTTDRGWSSPEAHEAWMRGRYLLRSGTEQDCRASIGYFERAIELQPSSAAAHAGLADGYSTMAVVGLVPPNEAVPRARVAARRALELDHTLADAYASLAKVSLYFDWDPETAGREYQRAVTLGRDRPDILLAYSRFLALVGRYPEATAAAREAAALDPLNPDGALAVAWAEYQAGDHDAALSTLRVLLQADPASAGAHMQAAWNHAQKGDCPSALESARRTLALVPMLCEDQQLLPTLAWVLATCGDRDEARRLRDRLREVGARRWVDPVALALAYAGLGETDEAFRLVERAVDVRSPSVVLLRVDPLYSGLRRDARFAEVARCADFDGPSWAAARDAAAFVPRPRTRQ